MEQHQLEFAQCLITLDVPERDALNIASILPENPERVWHMARKQFIAVASKVSYIPSNKTRKDCLSILVRALEGVRVWLERFARMEYAYRGTDKRRRFNYVEKELIKLFWDAGIRNRNFLGRVFDCHEVSLKIYIKGEEQ